MTKTIKALEIFYRLLMDDSVSKEELYQIIGKEEDRYIRRYISTINDWIAEYNSEAEPIQYKQQRYHLTLSGLSLSEGEMIAVSKILLASKGLNDEEMKQIIAKLSRTARIQQHIKQTIAAELIDYQPLDMNQPMTELISDLNKVIEQQQTITIDYSNAVNETKTHHIRPLFMTFNRNYFYIVGINDKKYTMYLRVDRIQDWKKADKEITVEIDTLTINRMKMRRNYMFNGEHQRVIFEFHGIPEYVVDEFPEAKVIKSDYSSSEYTFEVETIGDGILMWMLSQGSRVKVKSPVSMVEKYRDEVKRMYETTMSL